MGCGPSTQRPAAQPQDAVPQLAAVPSESAVEAQLTNQEAAQGVGVSELQYAASSSSTQAVSHPVDEPALQQLAPNTWERGVTVRWLLETFAKTVQEANGENSTKMTTREVVATVIMPKTSALRCPYVQLVRGSKPPQHFAVHAWDRPFDELLTCLHRHYALEDSVWLDIFAINQHAKEATDAVLAIVRQVVEHTQSIALVLDPDGRCLTRTWCLMELHMAVTEAAGNTEQQTTNKKPTRPTGRLEVLPYCLLDTQDRANLVESLANIAVQSAESSLPADFEAILADNEAQAGSAPAFNMAVTNGLVAALAATPALFPPDSLERTHLQAFMGGLLSDVGPDETAYDLALPLLEAALEAARKETGKADLEADDLPALKALCALGTLQVRREELQTAEPLLLQAHEGLTSKLGESNLETIHALHSLASLYSLQGEHARAHPLFAKASQRRQEVLGNDNIDTLASQYCHATALLYVGEVQQAGEVSLQVLQRLTSLRGISHKDTLSAMTFVGTVRQAEGKLEEAEKLYTEALQGRKALQGEDHLETVCVSECLAGLSLLRGDHKAAKIALMRVAEVRRTAPSKGPQHSDTLNAMHHLAMAHDGLGETQEAEALYKQILESSEESKGKDHADTALAAECLGTLYYNRGDHEAADPMYRRAVEVRKRTSGEGSAATLAAMALLAGNHEARKEFGQAEELFVLVVQGRKELLGETHADTLTSQHALSSLRYSAGDYAAAAEAGAAAVQGRQAELGEEHADTLASMYLLALVYEVQSDLAKAEPLHAKAWEVRQACLGESHTEALASLDGLVRVYTAQEDNTRAQPLLTKAWEIRKVQAGEDHEDTLASLDRLANCHYGQGHLTEAEELFTELYTKRSSALGKEHPDTLSAMHSLAVTYHSLGNAEMAYACYNEALSKRWEVLGQAHPDSIATMDLYEQLLKEMGMMEDTADGQKGQDTPAEPDQNGSAAEGGEGPPLTFIYHPPAEDEGKGQKPDPIVFVLDKESDQMMRQSSADGLAIAAEHGCL